MRKVFLGALMVLLLGGVALAEKSPAQRKAISVGITLQKAGGEKFVSPVTVRLVQGEVTVYGKAEDGLAWIQQVPWGLWNVTIPGWETSEATLEVAPGKPARVTLTVLGKTKEQPKGTTVIVRVPGGAEGQRVTLIEKIGETCARRISANISGGKATIPFVPKGKWYVSLGDGSVIGNTAVTVGAQKQVSCTIRIHRQPRTGRRIAPAGFRYL